MAFTMYFNGVTQLQSIFSCPHSNVSRKLVLFTSRRRLGDLREAVEVLFHYSSEMRGGGNESVQSSFILTQSNHPAMTLQPLYLLLKGLISEQMGKWNF